jgi:hypothetical protein
LVLSVSAVSPVSRIVSSHASAFAQGDNIVRRRPRLRGAQCL